MTSGDWSDPNALALGIYLDGSDDPDRAGDRVTVGPRSVCVLRGPRAPGQGTA